MDKKKTPLHPAEAAASEIQIKVLVAEDNPVNQKMLKFMLSKLNCQVDAAFNGRDAVEAVRRNRYDLVFMDFFMPEMDGCEAAQKIREQEAQHTLQESTGGPPLPYTTIIAVTGHDGNDVREQLLSAGMDDYLCKPFGLDQITAILDKWALQAPSADRAPDGNAQDPAAPCSPPLSSSEESGQESTESNPFDNTLDQNALDLIRELQKQGAPNLLSKIIDIYLLDAPKHIGKLRESMAVKDLDVIQNSSHTLKSSSANLGALRLSSLCKDLENHAREKTLENIAGLLEQIEQEYQKIEAALAWEREKSLL